MCQKAERRVSRLEISSDAGAAWADAKIDYPGTRLTWALWSHEWRPERPGDFVFYARATNRDGEVQTFDANRPFKSGMSGFHKMVVHVA